MSAYPGFGNEYNGSLVLYPTFYVYSNLSPYVKPGGPGVGTAILLGSSGTGWSAWYTLPKLAAGDQWTQAYLTGFFSSNITDAAAAVVATCVWYTAPGATQAASGTANSPLVSVVGGAELDPTSLYFLFPDLRKNFAQGIAQPMLFDLSMNNAGALSGKASSFLTGLQAYNTSGARNVDVIQGGASGNADFHIDFAQRDRGGTTSAFYNPVLTLFSLLQYAWIPPSAGGISIAPELLVLGMFGGRRNA